MNWFLQFYFFLIILIAPSITEACSVCFGGDPQLPQIVALKWGILVLLGILLIILFLFAMFFFNLRKKSKFS